MKKYALAFFDDILVYSPFLESHLKHVEMLTILKNHQLYAKRSKCSFAQSEVEYLGHIIFDRGVMANPKKVESMMN